MSIDPNDSSTEVAAAYNAGLLSANSEERCMMWGGDGESEDHTLALGAIPSVILNPGQTHKVLDDVLQAWERRQPKPARRKGTATLLDVRSFVDHVQRMKSADSTIWASPQLMSVLAIYDYHPPGGDPAAAAWGLHRAQYACPRSPEWLFWTALEGTAMNQDSFAEVVENRYEDVRGGDSFPTSSELLEMARDLRVHSKGTFERKVDPVTGQFAMVCKEEHEASSTKIPRAFRLGLRVFDGGDIYAVEARIAFRLVQGKPTFGFTLHRKAEIERDAFDAIIKQVGEKTALPVFVGSPE